MKTRLLLWIVVGACVATPCVAQTRLGDLLSPNMAEVSEVEVTPMLPDAADEVSVTFRGYKPASNYYISSVDKQIEGSNICLNPHWASSGIGTQAFMPYEYTVPLGTLSPGTYIVHVRDVTATFTVRPSLGLPSGQGDIAPPDSTPQCQLRLQVTPTLPNDSQDVSVVISGWTVPIGHIIHNVDTHAESSDIYIDLYWMALPEDQQWLLSECTVSLGTLDPEMHTVHVTCHGSLGGTATTKVLVSRSPGQTPTLTASLPGFEINHMDWTTQTSIKEGISRLRISPAAPTPSDVVSVTVSGWKPANNLVIGNATIQIEGQTIRLDLYWQEQTPPPAPTAVNSGGAMDQMQACSFSVTVTQYDLTSPYEGVPYEYIRSLGTFAAGTYTLNVANHGPVSGSASTSFIVKPTGQSLPWPAWFTGVLSH